VALVHERRLGAGGLDSVEDGGQLLVPDLDERGRLLGVTRALGGDGGDGVAGVQRPVESEHGLVLDLNAVGAELAYVVRYERNAVPGERGGVDGHDPGVWVRRPDDARVQLAGERDVLRIADCAGDAEVAQQISSSARRTSTATTRRR
jgi:hypothetical protein